MRPLLVIIAVLLVVASGCSKITSQSTLSSTGKWTIPGVVRIGTRYPLDSLDPLIGTQQIDAEVSAFWAGYLFVVDDKNELVPDLATVVPTLENGGIGKDGRTITYHLRPGVTWQDGAPFTASDVLFTYRVVMDPDNPVPSRVGFDLIDSVRARDTHTVIVRLRRTYAPFVATFLTVASSYPYCVLPQHLFGNSTKISHAAFNTSPIGTGPFRVTRYEPGSEIVMDANEHYWRGKPHLRQVDIRIVPNDNTLLTLVRTHEIDIYYRMPHAYDRQVAGEPGMRLVSVPFTRFNDIGFNIRSPFLSDVRVRQALAYATDKRSIITRATLGSDIFADSDQPRYLWAYDAGVPKYAYDPQKAAALLDKAGWHLGPDGIREKNGVPMRLGLAGIAGDAVSTTIRELLQAQWRRVGVDTEIKSYPSDILYGRLADGGIEQTGHYDVVVEGFANGLDPDDSVLFECRWQPPYGQNTYRICDPSLDAAEEAALSTNDQSARKIAYARVQTILATQLPIIVLYFERYNFAVNSDLRGLKLAHVNAAFWNSWQWQI